MSPWKIVLAIVLILVLAVVVFILILSNKVKGEMKGLTYEKVDLARVKDGVYNGKSETSLVKVEVAVTVTNHRIVKIDILRHDNGKGKPAERIADDIVEANDYQVDSISGATMSSEVIKSAVSNALAKGD